LISFVSCYGYDRGSFIDARNGRIGQTMSGIAKSYAIFIYNLDVNVICACLWNPIANGIFCDDGLHHCWGFGSCCIALFIVISIGLGTPLDKILRFIMTNLL
jgi:hypothetical protein